MKAGDKCTVGHHYGHTDTEKVMTITSVQPDERYNSGTSVSVDGLSWSVDSGLVTIIKQLTVQELGLYICQPCLIYSTLTKCWRKDVILASTLNAFVGKHSTSGNHSYTKIKPVLRQRNAITHNELIELQMIEALYVRPDSAVCQYALMKKRLSFGIDLFDYIPEGYAVDADKLVKGKQYYE